MTEDRGRAEAERLWERLAAGLAATDDEHDDLDPEVRSFDNEHYYVAFRLRGQRVALTPADARGFAEDLLLAADDAEARHEQEETTAALAPGRV